MDKIILASVIETNAPAVDFYRNSAVWPHIDGIQFMGYPLRGDWGYALTGADVLFLDRSSAGAVSMVRAAKEKNVPVILDLDDDLFNISPYHPNHDLLMDANTQRAVKEVIQAAAHVIVTTPALRDLYALHNANITVIPNCWNDYVHYMVEMDKKKQRKKQHIAHRGAKAHQRDVYEASSVINRHLNEMEWYFYGNIPIAVDLNFNRVPFMPLHQFFAAFAQSSPDFLLVPLADTPFNQSKSNIAWIEASVFAGAVVIAPDYLPEFDRAGVVRYSGLNKALEQAKKMDYAERVKRVKAAQAQIEQTLRLSEWNKVRMQVVEQVMSASGSHLY